MIYSSSDVKLACNQALKAAFPKVKIYSNETLDGYERPSFFTELISHGRRKPGMYLTQTGFTFRITYFERTHNEAHCLEVYERICKAFEPALRVKGHTRIFVNNTEYNWIDENADKLQVTISFYDAVELGGYTEEEDTMQELDMNFESEV